MEKETAPDSEKKRSQKDPALNHIFIHHPDPGKPDCFKCNQPEKVHGYIFCPLPNYIASGLAQD